MKFFSIIGTPETNRDNIKLLAVSRQEENESFRIFLSAKDSDMIDAIVHRLNESVTATVDCTKCGACCQTLMINITEAEATNAACHLEMQPGQFAEKYIEQSHQGQLIINTIPCHFLEDKKCSIYNYRFAECRQFPHLDRKNFKDRLFGTLIHYAMCPIIFNVVEALKVETGFKNEI